MVSLAGCAGEDTGECAACMKNRSVGSGVEGSEVAHPEVGQHKHHRQCLHWFVGLWFDGLVGGLGEEEEDSKTLLAGEGEDICGLLEQTQHTYTESIMHTCTHTEHHTTQHTLQCTLHPSLHTPDPSLPSPSPPPAHP